MATYVIADIHGCYGEYRELLRKINFSDEDTLYVLGDAVDRGPEPIKVLLDLMARPNVFYILGNHDAMMLSVLRDLAVEITEESILDLPDNAFLKYFDWARNGGEVTARQFRAQPAEVRKDILEYLEEASIYETVEEKGKLYILVHAGIANFSLDKEPEDYAPQDFLWECPDYGRRYFPGGRIILVTGHTPTPNIRADKEPLVYEENGHIALDCGCAFGGKLAAYCLESGEIAYVPKRIAEVGFSAKV